MTIERETCQGCGAVLERIDGPSHDYMLSSPACFERYTQILAAEYSDPALMRIHRLSVDSFAIQHPGSLTDRRAIQSVGLHLARLAMQLEHLRTPQQANDIMLTLGRHKAELIWLEPPRRFAITAKDIAEVAGTPDHSDRVIEWARAAWEDWSAHHAYILARAARHMGS